MADTAATSSRRRIPPRRRSELVFKPLGNDGEHVVKDPRTGQYFNLPRQESFLFNLLDGKHSTRAIRRAFEKEFGEPLSEEDLDGFVEMAREQGFLVREKDAPPPPPKEPKPLRKRLRKILYWRKNFYDPDKFFNRVEPRIRFIWTAGFFWLSLTGILFSAGLFWANMYEFAEYVPDMIRWETFVLGWFILFAVTTGHEFAHGLTCKHYGGEVHEVGFLLMFFMPCFYCNVTDAWLFKEKSRRIWVMLAGGYHDLCLWAVAVVACRVLLPHTLPFHIAFIIMSICGGRVLLNFNPLMRLDGYYLASDILEVPNLRRGGYDRVADWFRWLMWGAPPPEPHPHGRALLTYGLLSMSFSVTYLTLMLFGLIYLLRERTGLAVAVILDSFLGWLIYPRLLRGIFAGEVYNMFRYRHLRVAAWVVVLTVVGCLAFLVPIEDWVSGTFRTRSLVRQEVRAPVSGFLQTVYCDEGHPIKEKAVIGSLEIPDLSSKLTQKEAELNESRAKLNLLLAGTRHEQIAEQRLKVKRAHEWRDRAKVDLDRKQTALREELERLDRQISQANYQLNYTHNALEVARKLLRDNALPYDSYRDAERQYKLAFDEHGKAKNQKAERDAVGTLEQEGELAKREKELKDEQSALTLLEAGSRPEEIDAEKARFARLEAEKAFLRGQQEKLQLLSPVSGIIVTPYLRERIGSYFNEGELICEIEDPQTLEVEVPIEEQDVNRVSPKLSVLLKPRAMPLHTCDAEVERIAPSAAAGKVQAQLTVYCRLKYPVPELVSGMTGYARIYCGGTSIAGYLGGRVIRYFRTEIWW